MLKEREEPAIHHGTSTKRTALLRDATLSIGEILDSQVLWQEIANWASKLSGARYSALLTLDESGEAGEFVAVGMSAEQASQISPKPAGKGILGSINANQQPVRLADIAGHPDSTGFPPNHPAMRTFMGMAIRRRGKHLANLYLADKENGLEFTAEDEEVLSLFADHAAVALSNASKHQSALHAKADLEALVNIAPMGVVVFDARAGKLAYGNNEARRILEEAGIPSDSWDDALKNLTYRRADGREISLNEFPLVRVLQSGETIRAEEILISLPDGRSVTTLVNAAPIYSDKGDIDSVIVVLQDLTPLEEMDRMRSDYLSLVSHEMRTPLSTIKGSISALEEIISQSGSAESRQLMRIIDLQADMMRSQINRLIDLTQVEAGTLTVSPEPLALAPLLKEARREFLRSMSGHEIELDIEAGVSRVVADGQRIGQVLQALLRWGVKCSPPSSSLRLTAHREDVSVAVSLAVDGNASPTPELCEVFEELERTPVKELRRNREGEKLAAAVCKGIVNAHGGRLWAEAGEDGQGLTLGFSIPIGDEPESPAPTTTRPVAEPVLPLKGSKARILSVVENPRMLNAIQRTLSRSGYVPIGSLDIMALDRLISDEKPHLILLDLTRPRLQDFEVIQRITQDHGVPAIILSGQGDDEWVVRAFEMGADDYIVKPFSPSELVARIKALFRKRASAYPSRTLDEYSMGELVINYPERKVTVSGRKVHLTATEYQLLYELSTKSGRVLSQDELLRRIWGEEYLGDIQLLRAFVKTLRQKLGDNARKPVYIFTEHGIGYRMPKP